MRYLLRYDDEIPATGLEGIKNDVSMLQFPLLPQQVRTWEDNEQKILLNSLKINRDGAAKSSYGFTTLFYQCPRKSLFRTILLFCWISGCSLGLVRRPIKNIRKKLLVIFIFSNTRGNKKYWKNQIPPYKIDVSISKIANTTM